jgi:2-dehydropantoate 2-reductase
MNSSGKKIAIIGSGAMGLYYGGHLASSGLHVHFLMRSGFQTAKEKGLRITSTDHAEIVLPHISAHADTTSIGPCDLVVICIKAFSNPELPALLAPLIKESTLLLTMQNGLGNEEFLADHWGAHRVLGGVCFVCLTRTDSVTVHHQGHGKLSIGEFGGGSAGAATMIASLFQNAGIDAHTIPNLLCERWRKLVWNVPFNGLSVAEGGITVDQILSDPRRFALARQLMEEVIAIAHSEGCEIGTGFAEANIESTKSMGAYQPSTLVDWLAGNMLEIEPIWGVPLRRAAAAGVSVPALQSLYASLLGLQTTS